MFAYSKLNWKKKKKKFSYRHLRIPYHLKIEEIIFRVLFSFAHIIYYQLPLYDLVVRRVRVDPTFSRTTFPVRLRTVCSRTVHCRHVPSTPWRALLSNTHDRYPNEWKFARIRVEYELLGPDNQGWPIVTRQLCNGEKFGISFMFVCVADCIYREGEYPYGGQEFSRTSWAYK